MDLRKLILGILFLGLTAGTLTAEEIGISPPPPSPPRKPPVEAPKPESGIKPAVTFAPPVNPQPAVTPFLTPVIIESHFPKEMNLAVWEKYLADGGDINAVDTEGCTPLFYAVRRKNVEICRFLVEHAADVNHPNQDGLTPLMEAEDYEIARTLLEAGADATRVCGYGFPALDHAAGLDSAKTEAEEKAEEEACEKMVSLFVEHGVDLDARYKTAQSTLLMLIAWHPQKTALMKALIKKGAAVNLQDDDGKTALMHAVWSGNAKTAKLLLDAGADANLRENNGITPLIVSVWPYNMNMAVFDALLEAGADVNAEYNHYRPTALLQALENGHAEACEKLLEAGADISKRGTHRVIPLFMAAELFNPELMEKFIAKGADIFEKTDPADETLLFPAARVGDVALCRRLTEKGLDVNAKNRWGRTLVHTALMQGEEEVVRFLVENGAKLKLSGDEERTNRDGSTGASPLQTAVKNGDVAFCEFLVRHGARFLDNDSDQKKLIHYAVESGSPDMCRYVLNFNPDINAPGSNRKTALHEAAILLDYDLCVFLLSAGADVDARDEFGRTPLMMLRVHMNQVAEDPEECASPRMVRLLLDAGADMNAADREGRTLMDYLLDAEKISGIPVRAFTYPPGAARVEGFFAKYLQVLSGRFYNAELPEAFFLAAKDGDTPEVKRLLELGKDVNEKDKDGETALHYAVRGGRAETCETLLEHGADVNAPGINAGTPLHYAAAFGRKEILETLLKHGADRNAKTTKTGASPLHWAIYASQGPCVTALVKNGADISFRDNHNQSVFDLALKMKKEPYCRFFCRNGYDVNAAAGNFYFGQTYSWEGIDGRRLTRRTLEILKNCGLDFNTRDLNGNTLLHHAVERGLPKLISFLIKEGADPAIKNNFGETPPEMLEKMSMPATARSQIKIMMSTY